MNRIFALAPCLFAAALCAAGCGGDDDDDGSGGFAPPSDATCVARTGAYTVTLTEKSGDCGGLDPQIVVADAQPDPGCTGTSSPPTACVETEDVTCPSAQGTSTRVVGQIRWDGSGTRGTGTWQVTILAGDGVALCQSTYDVSITR